MVWSFRVMGCLSMLLLLLKIARRLLRATSHTNQEVVTM